MSDSVSDRRPRTPALRHALRALGHRDFAIFWTGALASNIGSWVQNMTVPFVIYEITDSAFWVGFATFAQFLPGMLLGPLGGSIADRANRRKVLIVTQAALAVTALVQGVAWVAGIRGLSVILALVTLSGILAGLNLPSWQAFVNDLVPTHDLLSAITLNSLQFNASRAIGPAIAGVVLATAGADLAFLLNAVSFLFVIVALLAVRTRPVPHHHARAGDGGVLRRFGEAVRYTRRQPGIRMGILIGVLVGFLGNPVQQFTVVFAVDEFNVGPVGLALLNVTLGLGAVLAFFAVSGWDRTIGPAAMTRGFLIIYATSIVVFAVSPAFALALVVLVFTGGGYLAVVSLSNTSIQVIVADHLRGRVMALRIMAFTGSYPLGALVQGWAAELVGVRATVCVAGSVLLVSGVALARGRAWKHLDDPHDDAPPEPGEPSEASYEATAEPRAAA